MNQGKRERERQRKMQGGTERKKFRGEEREERWEKGEAWLLSAVSTLPADQRCSVWGPSELLTLKVLEQWKPRRPKSENQRTLAS